MDIYFRTKTSCGLMLSQEHVISTNDPQEMVVGTLFELFKKLPKVSDRPVGNFHLDTGRLLRAVILRDQRIKERNKMFAADSNAVLTVWGIRNLLDFKKMTYEIKYQVEVQED